MREVMRSAGSRMIVEASVAVGRAPSEGTVPQDAAHTTTARSGARHHDTQRPTGPHRAQAARAAHRNLGARRGRAVSAPAVRQVVDPRDHRAPRARGEDVVGDVSRLGALQSQPRGIGNHVRFIIVLLVLRFKIPVKAPSRAMLPTGERPLSELIARWDHAPAPDAGPLSPGSTGRACGAPSCGTPSRARSASRRRS